MRQNIRFDSLIGGAKRAVGMAVIIDVFRAFTTAAGALANGATKVIIVRDVEEALRLRAAGVRQLCMGQVGAAHRPALISAIHPSRHRRPTSTVGPLFSARASSRNLPLPARLSVLHKGSFAMKKLASVVFAAALSAVSVDLARADQPGPDWMPMEQVRAKVLQSGYTQVTKLEADDGRWEGEGIKNGQKMDFHADPKTGVITFEKLDD
jgi:Peptidase propeptide and YPEB domain/2-phosphosulpholactate phosphatase